MDWEHIIPTTFGITIEGLGRGFKGRKQQDYVTNFAGKLVYNPNYENIGSQLTISPSWRQSTESTQLSLWQSNLAGESDTFNRYPNGVQIKTEYSYGISLLDGIGTLTPFSAIDYFESDLITYNIGNRIKFGTNTSFDIIGTHEVRNKKYNQ